MIKALVKQTTAHLTM